MGYLTDYLDVAGIFLFLVDKFFQNAFQRHGLFTAYFNKLLGQCLPIMGLQHNKTCNGFTTQQNL